MSNCTQKSSNLPLPEYKGVMLDGYKIWDVGSESFINFVKTKIIQKQKTIIHYLNAHTYNISVQNENYRTLLKNADILYPDGISISLAVWLKYRRWIERMTGLDFFDAFLSVCEEQGFTLYFLGGSEGIAEKARKNILKHYPKLKITGLHNGFFIADGKPENKIISDINNSQPDILLVGMGSPIQEFFVDRHRNEINSYIIWTIGALLDYYAGVEKQAPRWLAKIGFEWAYRLIQNPRGKWKRYIIGNCLFAYNISKALLKRNKN